MNQDLYSIAEKETMDELRRQYEAERSWAEKLLTATPDERLGLYAEINDAYYNSKSNPDEGSDIDLQVQLLAPYISKASVVVEVGSGAGGVVRRLAPLVSRYIANEASANACRTLELPANAELILSADLRFDLPDESVDLVYSCHVVEHLHADDAKVLACEMRRILKVGGKLVWVTPNRLLGPHDISQHYSKRATGLHLHEYTFSELADLLEASGYTSVRALAGIGRPAKERKLGGYRFAEWLLDRLPVQLRRSLMSIGLRRPPFRWMEQVALVAVKSSANPRHAVEPFLHLDSERIYNPLTDLTLETDNEMSAAIKRLISKAASTTELENDLRQKLEQEQWIIPQATDVSSRHRLHFVSLETTSVCNQACSFCPVSIAPRPPEIMEQQLFEDIADQLDAFTDTLQAIFLHNYNEPTADPLLIDRIRALKKRKLPVAINSNASGLTKRRVDDLVELGGIAFLSINLSTLDSSRYQAERGADHLARVLSNLDYAGGQPVAKIMEVAVLGCGDKDHRKEVSRIRERLSATRFVVKSFLINHRAGALEIGLKPDRSHKRLRGCDHIGSRPLQHLHITASGVCVLCCQDYHERHVVGNLTQQTVREVIEGPKLRQLRRWIYGLDEATGDLLCRNCIYARS